MTPELIAEIPIQKIVLDSMDATTGWVEDDQGTSPTLEDGKEGAEALGLGTTGSGTGTYEKNVELGSFAEYDQVQCWLFGSDVSDFGSIRIKFGRTSSNYFYFDVSSGDMEDGVWKMAYINVDDLQIQGSPNLDEIKYLSVQILTAGGAITAGDVRIDALRIIKTHYEYSDYNVDIGESYIYSASTYNSEQLLESNQIDSDLIEVEFTNPYINMFLTPVGAEDLTVEAFMDGSKPPNWIDRTETKYYQTKGAAKPTAITNLAQQYKEGSIELRFFDTKLGGQGLDGVEALQFIKNYKPILLRTWWGRNYYISIDGDLNVVRKPGIGWYVTFSFTEINTT